MTIKRISTRTEVTGRIPFRRHRREVPDEKILEPGYQENILIGSKPLSQGSGRVEYYPRTLIVTSEDSIVLVPVDNQYSYTIEREEIDFNLRDSYECATPMTDSDKGPRRFVEFEWKPSLPSQSRK